MLPKKKNFEIWSCLDQNHGLTALEKCQFFDFLNFLFLYPRNELFRSRISYKTFCWPILTKKELLHIWPLLDQNQGLTPSKKCQFFDFLNFLVLLPRKALFSFRISLKTFSWPILPKKKKLEKLPFLDKNDGLTALEKCQFFDFLKFLFL